MARMPSAKGMLRDIRRARRIACHVGAAVVSPIGPRSQSVVSNPDTVSVYRIANPLSDSDYESLKRTRPLVAGYPMRRGVGALLKPQNISVDVVICFACGDVVYIPSSGLHEDNINGVWSRASARRDHFA